MFTMFFLFFFVNKNIGKENIRNQRNHKLCISEIANSLFIILYLVLFHSKFFAHSLFILNSMDKISLKNLREASAAESEAATAVWQAVWVALAETSTEAATAVSQAVQAALAEASTQVALKVLCIGDVSKFLFYLHIDI